MTGFFPEPPPEDPAPADARLARRIAAALGGHEGVRAGVQNGVVILTGVVPDAPSHDAVLRHVRETGGARDLCDGLTVRGGGSGPGREAELFGELAARLALRPAPRGPGRGVLALIAGLVLRGRRR
ncbi:BON domain-containing protein [Actinoplanes sp. NPDC000266]